MSEESCRIQISLRLKETDHLVQISDHGKLAEIKAYRQKLRDFPTSSDWPDVNKLPEIYWT